MTIRSEIESRLITWAQAQVPPILVSLEGVPFTKPTDGSAYLQIFFLGSASTNTSVDGLGVRVRGIAQINCCVPDGKGSKQVEALSQNIVDLFPVVPKSLFTTVSIEQTPSVGQAMIDATWRIVPVTIKYRQENKY